MWLYAVFFFRNKSKKISQEHDFSFSINKQPMHCSNALTLSVANLICPVYRLMKVLDCSYVCYYINVRSISNIIKIPAPQLPCKAFTDICLFPRTQIILIQNQGIYHSLNIATDLVIQNLWWILKVKVTAVLLLSLKLIVNCYWEICSVFYVSDFFMQTP